MSSLSFEAIRHIQSHLGIYHDKSAFTLMAFLQQAFLSDENNEVKTCHCCQNFYGVALICGHGVEKDVQTGIMLVETAAEQGYTKAQVNIAIFYEQGKCVNRDLKKARDYCQLAADQGDPSAIRILPRITRKYEMSVMMNETENRLHPTE